MRKPREGLWISYWNRGIVKISRFSIVCENILVYNNREREALG